MVCPNCRSFTRGPYPQSDLRASYSWKHLLKSAKHCECCDILIEGCRGLLGDLHKRESDVKSCDIWLAYEPNHMSNERDCQKLITLNFATGSLSIEYTALQGLLKQDCRLINSAYEAQTSMAKLVFPAIGTICQPAVAQLIAQHQTKHSSVSKIGYASVPPSMSSATASKIDLYPQGWWT